MKCIAVLLLAALASLHAQSLSQVPFRTVEAYWSFGDGLHDWATSSTAAMEAEVNVNGGLLHGVALGESPYIDSPLLALVVDDRHYLVLRMAYDGLCSSGRVLLERGPPVGTFTNRKAPFERPTTFDFSLRSDGAQHIYYIPIYTLGDETISRIRLYPCATRAQLGQSFDVDWIQIIKAPTITKVRGCIDQYFATSARTTPMANVTLQMTKTNAVHPRFTSLFGRLSLPYATTYNCMANDTIAIQGRHFGDTSIVHINGQPCLGPSTLQVPTLASDAFEEEVLLCTLPPNALDAPNPAIVTVINEAFRGLHVDGRFVTYAQPVTLTQAPTLSNVAAHAMDVTWAPPSDFWQSLATTGYRVAWTDGIATASLVVGNVTTTTIRPLATNATYNVTVTALVENQRTARWQDVDMYGRRAMDVSAVVGSPSPVASPAVRTLLHDIAFSSFSAAAVLNNSATYPYTTLGPTGDAGGQGAFGLVLLGHANVENCNSTSVCCDILTSTNACYLTCAALPIASARSAATASLTAIRNSSAVAVPPAVLPLPPCGPALRLTGSAPYATGAAWYPRPMTVREGFSTTFALRISNPSFHCKFMDDVSTHCRSRGGDGLAFVLQGVNTSVVGRGGAGLGYAGLHNALSVEFDTWYNDDLADAYENHVSVQTRGFGSPNSAHHAFSLGATTAIPDLTDGSHVVTITYTPLLSTDMAFAPHFQPSAYVSQMLPHWNTLGLGCLMITIDGLDVLSVPLHLDATLQLGMGGRAYVGFTAATGAATWQVHDILSWTFDADRLVY